MATSPLLTTEEQTNIEVIDSFVAAWNARDPAKVMSFFAEDARFSVGFIGKTPDPQKPDFLRGVVESAVTLKMRVTPGTTWARGPVVTHERIDEIVLPEQDISGKFIAVFTLRDSQIVDFIDFLVP